MKRFSWRNLRRAAGLAAIMLLSGAGVESSHADSLYGFAPSIYSANATVPGFKRGKVVAFANSFKAGTVVVRTKANVLYLVLDGNSAVQYRVATAKKGFEWRGQHRVSSKTTWPDWRPPEEMRKRRPELPDYMAGGPENPLGARALYLGSSIYRIHGTNEPKSIGKAASSGCIRMLNGDVSELYAHVKVGALVVVM
jgi:lipoprotein-anchoring transpeptidase ErfK/SrfK